MTDRSSASPFRAAQRRQDGFLPLRGYGLLSDGRSCALVGEDGAVDWWALPTMADAPTFGAVLDSHRGGRLALRPDGEFEVRRWYVGGGAVLATEFRTSTGVVRVTDALTLGAGSLLPWTELARRVDAVDGEVTLRWEVRPGERFGGLVPWARNYGDIPLVSVGPQQLALVLREAGAPEVVGGGYRGAFSVSAGEPALLAVVAVEDEPSPVPTAEEVLRRVEETGRHWADWSDSIDYDGPWRDAVLRSAVVHKQLTLSRSGGMQAAATTSLPEKIGGSRNFDYRFSWVRDTAFALDALTSLQLRGEVHAAMSHLAGAVRRTAPDVRVLYTTDGTDSPSSLDEVSLWEGYRRSQPVQVGNNAASQRQLGAYGDLLEAIKRYADHGNVLDAATGQLVAQVADQVCDQWAEQDAGLWELGTSRPYTSSKIGCWAALNRAAALVGSGQIPAGGEDRWRQTAGQIRAYIDEACWSPAKRSYTFYAGTDDLDCATLLVARTGFCEPGDERLDGTIDAVRRELSAGGPLLYRYTAMRGQEGAFIACTFWLVEALAHNGRVDEARTVMDGMVDRANDLGLLTEEIDPDTQELLGNIPQALSHLALIGAATAFQRAVERSRGSAVTQ